MWFKINFLSVSRNTYHLHFSSYAENILLCDILFTVRSEICEILHSMKPAVVN